MILTKELLDSMKPGEIFRIVTTKYQTVHEPMKAELTFICKRGGVNDWAIYAGQHNWPIEHIKDVGQKVTREDNIRSICPCDDEAFSMYRY